MMLCKCGKITRSMFILNDRTWCSNCLDGEFERLKTFETWYRGHPIQSFPCNCNNAGFYIHIQNKPWCFNCLCTEFKRLKIFEKVFFQHLDGLEEQKSERIPDPPRVGTILKNKNKIKCFEDEMILNFLRRPDIFVCQGPSGVIDDIVVHNRGDLSGRGKNVIEAAKAAMLDEQR